MPYDPARHGPHRILGPGFHGKVHALVKQVPKGRVTTYGDLAGALGSRSVARQVGFALAALDAGTDVPWWRVVAAGGRLAPHAVRAQARALRKEGVAVKDRRVQSFSSRRFTFGVIHEPP